MPQKDAYWAAMAELLWRQVRGSLLPRMRGGERSIQAFMREPLTTEIAMIRLDRTPQTEDLEPVLFRYDEVNPGAPNSPYWAVEAVTGYIDFLMEVGDLPERVGIRGAARSQAATAGGSDTRRSSRRGFPPEPAQG